MMFNRTVSHIRTVNRWLIVKKAAQILGLLIVNIRELDRRAAATMIVKSLESCYFPCEEP